MKQIILNVKNISIFAIHVILPNVFLVKMVMFLEIALISTAF